MEIIFVSEVAKNTGISSFHNFRERMTSGSTPSIGLGISVEVRTVRSELVTRTSTVLEYMSDLV